MSTALIVGIWTTFAGYGYWIACIKGRRPGEGALLGLLLGPIGCVVAASLPERTDEEVEQERIRREEEAHARLAVEQARREGEQDRLAAFLADDARRRKDAKARAEAARARYAEISRRLAAWFVRNVVRFGWFKALPDVVQPIVIGLLIALPTVWVVIRIFKGRGR